MIKQLEPLTAKFVLLLTAALILGGLYIWQTGSSQANDPPVEVIPGTTYDRDPDNPSVVIRPVLPKPDPSEATDVEQGMSRLRAVPEVDAVFAAIESRDAETLLSLFVMTPIDCVALGRSAPRQCTDMPADNHLSVIGIEDGGSQSSLVAEPALALLRTVLASGEPQPVLATVNRSLDGGADTYYLAFSLPPFDASAREFKYASDTVGTGFGLKVATVNGETPIVSFSLLSADWNALKWIQMVDGEGASGHVLVFPESTDGFEAMYGRMGEP